MKGASLRPVLNGTGVILHTNLGRAPLAEVALAAVERIAGGYVNIEYDLQQGERGSRYVHCAELLRELTGAEDALVVNNGAAALMLALNTAAAGRDSVISRGELVEIGGSFRIPDIMAASGVRLVEVGTTNRTNLDDYSRAIGKSTGAVVKVHRSNFAMDGFVSQPSADELAGLSRDLDIPMIHDLGSGLLISLESLGLTGEPTAADAIRAGATFVTMSGDKLLGGPQAGIIVGSSDWIGRARSNPLLRALRVDKLTLTALEATLELYRDPPRAMREIPILAQLGASVEDLRTRAVRIVSALPVEAAASIVDSEASIGGGAFPTARIPSVALKFDSNAVLLERALRGGRPAVIGRMANRSLHIDLRTILPAEDDELTAALSAAIPAALAASNR
jgi:L-seryl-tRNA(Ser) seleniumtransferase